MSRSRATNPRPVWHLLSPVVIAIAGLFLILGNEPDWYGISLMVLSGVLLVYMATSMVLTRKRAPEEHG